MLLNWQVSSRSRSLNVPVCCRGRLWWLTHLSRPGTVSLYGTVLLLVCPWPSWRGSGGSSRCSAKLIDQVHSNTYWESKKRKRKRRNEQEGVNDRWTYWRSESQVTKLVRECCRAPLIDCCQDTSLGSRVDGNGSTPPWIEWWQWQLKSLWEGRKGMSEWLVSLYIALFYI
jgi:hypothetical protein